MNSINSFQDLYNLRRGKAQMPSRILCLDPGETTGWAFFENNQLVRWGQIKTVENEKILWKNVEQLFIEYSPSMVVCEDYRIYQHKLARHSFSPVLTLRLIGGIDLLCTLGWSFIKDLCFCDLPIYEDNNCPIHYQMATTAKTFCTDERLKNWGFYQEGMRHSRDAIRHGCYFLLFNKEYEVNLNE